MAKSELKKRIHSEVLSEESSDNESGELGAKARVARSQEPHFAGLEAGAAKRRKAAGGVAAAIMAKMGYTAGKGLGREEQGRTEALKPSDQKGRRGLGYTLADVVISEDLKWSSFQESMYVSVLEEVSWMPVPSDAPPDDDALLKSWVVRGSRPERMEEETDFCDAQVVQNICRCKSVFDNLSAQELRHSRSASNPFELIGKAFFQNRAALKMANMDARFDMMFTDPRSEDGQSVLEPKELLFFADICAGPGGFSEYVLWRKKWHAKGFGFTRKGPTDFKLEEFLAGSTETFEPHYGQDAVGGDGDIYNPQNLIAFRNFVLSNSGNGVHFVMADGGFSVEGQENLQEILSKRLYLCQFLCALGILKTGGHFVCKLFDCFTHFSVGLIYLMYLCFDRVTIFKPNTSRPANSERYLVCKSKRSGTQAVENHLFFVNCILDEVDNSNSHARDDVVQLVPLEVIKRDAAFYDSIFQSNTQLGRRQILFLSKVKAFAEDPSLVDHQQNEMKRKCLKQWQIPETIRKLPTKVSAVAKFKELMQIPHKVTEDVFLAKPCNLVRANLKSLEHHNSFRGVILSDDPLNASVTSKNRGVLISLSKFDAYFWDLSPGMQFLPLKAKLNLPSGSLLYVEQVYEMTGEGKGQKKSLAVHVIDAFFLGEVDVRHEDLVTRLMLTDKLIRGIHKQTIVGQTPMRAKQLFDLTEVEAAFAEDVEMREFKSGVVKCRLAYNLEAGSEKRDTRYMEASGLLVIPIVSHQYLLCWSKSRRQMYFFNKKTSRSEFTQPSDAVAGLVDCFKHSFFWKWESSGRNTQSEVVSTDIEDPEILDRDSFRRFFLSVKTGL